jgi:hypothetical protein
MAKGLLERNPVVYWCSFSGQLGWGKWEAAARWEDWLCGRPRVASETTGPKETSQMQPRTDRLELWELSVGRHANFSAGLGNVVG